MWSLFVYNCLMFTRTEKIVLAIFSAINFCHILDFVIMMPLGPQLMRIFNIDPHQFGLLVSIYTLAAGVSGVFCSTFIDKYDRKFVLVLFFVGFNLGTLACALSKTYPILLLARGVTGMFGGVLGSLILSATSDVISQERRGTAMGIIMGAFSVASVFGIPIGLYLANKINWHMPFMLLAILGGSIAFVAQMYLPSLRSHLKGPHPKRNFLFAFKNVLRDRNQMTAIAFIFSVIFGQFAIIPFLSPSLVANAGLKESQLPLIYLFGGIVSMVATPVFGRLSDKFGRAKIFYFGAFSSMIPVLIITNLGPTPAWLILVITSSFFLCVGGRMAPAMAMLSSAAPPHTRGSFMSISASLQQASAAISSYIAGYIVVKSSAGNLLNYNYVGLINVFFTGVAIYLAGKIKVEG